MLKVLLDKIYYKFMGNHQEFDDDDKWGLFCCFCDEKIIDDETDPVDIKITTNENMLDHTNYYQSFFSHFDCFRNNLHPSLKGYFTKESMHPSRENEVIVKYGSCLIKKIFELKNVDHWKLIYFGLDREIIHVQFVMEYCYVLIEQQNCSDQFVLDIAGMLNNDDLYNIPKMIAKKIGSYDEVIIDPNQYYTKIWSYLSSAADMCAEKIID